MVSGFNVIRTQWYQSSVLSSHQVPALSRLNIIRCQCYYGSVLSRFSVLLGHNVIVPLGLSIIGLGSMRPADLICHRVQLVQLQLYPAHSAGACTCSLTSMLTLMQGARLTGHEVIVSRNN